MNNRIKKLTLLTAGIMLAFSLLASYLDFASQFFHSLVNIFAGGRSNVKVFTFFAYTFALCIISLIPAIKIKLKNFWLFLTLGLTFFYNLFLFFYHTNQLGSKISDFIVTFNQSEISSSVLTHSHLMKGVGGLILGLLGLGVQENIDTGWAYSNLIPASLLWIGAILASLSIVLLILKFVQEYKKINKWPIFFIIIYSIISFSLIKNIFDGGLLNRETPIALTGLLFILFPIQYIYDDQIQSKLRLLLDFGKRFSPLIIYALLMSLLVVLRITTPTDLKQSLVQSMGFASLSLCLIYIYQKTKLNRQGVLFIILTILALYSPMMMMINDGFALNQKVVNKDSYIGLLTNSSNTEFKLIENIGGLNIYNYSPNQSYNIKEVLQQNHLLDNINPVSIPWVTCLPASGNQIIEFNLSTADNLDITLKTTHKFGNIHAITPQGEHGKFKKYNVKVSMDPCAPRPLNLIEGLIKERGANTFFIINLEILNDRN